MRPRRQNAKSSRTDTRPATSCDERPLVQRPDGSAGHGEVPVVVADLPVECQVLGVRGRHLEHDRAALRGTLRDADITHVGAVAAERVGGRSGRLVVR